MYERRLLQKHLDETGREPHTDHALTPAEIIAVHADPAVHPRAPSLTSIPALLSTFQNEWDALVLEAFTLKQQHQQVRQELAQALYQNDAACRVIARLMRERDEARQSLASLQVSVHIEEPASAPAAPAPASAAAAASVSESMDVDNATPEDAYYARAAETAKTLSAARMKREAPANLTSADTWKTAVQAGAVVEALHTSTKPGITTLCIDASGDLALTGAKDNHAEVYSRVRDQTVATLKGHTKKLTAAVWIGQRIVTGSADKSVRIWEPKAAKEPQEEEGGMLALPSGWAKKTIIKEHAAEIAAIAVHPSMDYFASAAVDGTWAIHSVDGTTIISDRLDSHITCIAFHPDGMFLAIATADGCVKILDVKQRQILASLDVSSTPIGGLHFSENGYHFATTCETEVAIWDLRKQKKSHAWTPADLNGGHAFGPAPARFDASGKYLAIVCGLTLHVFKAKGWLQLAAVQMTSDDHPDPESYSIEDIAWVGPLSTAVAAVTNLNSLVYFAPPANE
ncbi:hypothetical protein LPJ59_000352 [Coemansia sp. RSA 2399]|nr:hypothetical protein LPJ59_000352 [Coemansia sp. RSA 2399]KAJ1908111.1 hypothetical protein LPJ81_000310 [Coemansia sp. IMI 209127]